MSAQVVGLAGRQRGAVDPRESVWLSASAGSGKTQVLSARVLRLLLQPDVDPSQILCLTFTKAGAAEMAGRVNDVLASWVRMPDDKLFADLKKIGAPATPENRERARTRFASVLDCPGGGLRIDTIHAFAQWLLATFPEEAGLTLGSRPMEDRERDFLAHDVLAQLLVTAENEGDEATLSAIADLSRKKGPDAVKRWLMRCAAATDLWWGAGAWQPPMRPRACRILGLEANASEADLAGLCADNSFDIGALRQCMETNHRWPAKTGQQAAETISEWISADAARRVELLDELGPVFLKKDGTQRNNASLEKIDPAYPDCSERVVRCLTRIGELRTLLGIVDSLAPALELGRKFALSWERAKARDGYVDFDDQIRRAAALLRNSEMADWIRFKLDRRFDHILIDEAQDTNRAQWDIIFALIDDFFSGEGAHGTKLRTVFAVGDYKQAIFRFQGTDPKHFEAARQQIMVRMAAAAHNAEASGGNDPARYLREYGLDQSFRTAAPVLEFVDRAIASIGYREFGLDAEPEPHVGQKRAGLVTLWNTVREEEQNGEEEEGEDNWLSRHDRQLADRIARQVKRWIQEGFVLVKGRRRDATPGDIMVLVRKRKELAGLIVARLHAAGIPVAGVDRLRLGNPLAVKDLIAALRFAAQPLDDLNLANLLVSPLCGWTQEQLLEHGWRGKGRKLWDHLRGSGHPFVRATLERLGQLLARADFEPPQALLHWILVGPWQGRHSLVARLGYEANDPIDELLNAAHAYANAHTPSLQGFLRWFEAGDGELKREVGEGSDLVRVMTVHGAKGLQAPIVILADAAVRAGRPSEMELAEELPGDDAVRKIPILDPNKQELVGPLVAAHEAAVREELQEHWRLLYVAMTRAEEALFIGGSLGKMDKGVAPDDSWYARLQPLFDNEPLEDDIWGARWEWGTSTESAGAPATRKPEYQPGLPEWAKAPIGPEPQPPRPLAPSRTGQEQGGDPPFPEGYSDLAARRGVLMHRLLERLPEVPPKQRGEAGRRWLANNATDFDEAARNEMVMSVLAVISTPEWQEIFAPEALAEVPIMATVGKQVVAGTIDRLLVERDRITVIDFKTARNPPENVEDVPIGILRQMSAYVAALEVIYPGREVDAAVLYTHIPRLIRLPVAMIDAHKPGLVPAQETYPG